MRDDAAIIITRGILGMLVLLWAVHAQGAPIELEPGTVSALRLTRSANDVGLAPGDRIQFSVEIVGGSAGTTIGVVPPGGCVVVPPIEQVPCVRLSVNTTFCAITPPFNGDGDCLKPWTLRFENGSDVREVLTPSLVGAEDPVPFLTNVTISGSGVTPTIAWRVPAGFTPDGIRVNIHDKSLILANGNADVIHTVNIAGTPTSYTIPSRLSSGQQLRLGGNYTIDLVLVATRGHVPFTRGNPQILRASASFFAFFPLSTPGPPNVFLPTVVDGVYNFSIMDVGPSTVTFIDPIVAVGYDYAIGKGDPNFASVRLPNVGDGQFTLEYRSGGSVVQEPLAYDPDVSFPFPQGGVSAFRVTGIEASAGLDPRNATAFITGLTFVTQGNFTGTMRPITRAPNQGRVHVGLASSAGQGWWEVLDPPRVASGSGMPADTPVAWLRLPWDAYNNAVGGTRPVPCNVDTDAEDEVVIGLDSYPGNGGWIEIRDDRKTNYAHLAWVRVDWPDYNRANGATYVGCGDLNGDGRAEIVVGLGPGGGGWLAIFDDATTSFAHRQWIRVPWSEYNTANGATYPAVGDLDGDGLAELAIGLGSYPGAGGWVEIRNDTLMDYAHRGWARVSWPEYNTADGATYPALGDLDGDGQDELVIGLGSYPGAGGWYEAKDDVTAGLGHLFWGRVRWQDYNSTDGETRPQLER